MNSRSDRPQPQPYDPIGENAPPQIDRPIISPDPRDHIPGNYRIPEHERTDIFRNAFGPISKPISQPNIAKHNRITGNKRRKGYTPPSSRSKKKQYNKKKNYISPKNRRITGKVKPKPKPRRNPVFPIPAPRPRPPWIINPPRPRPRPPFPPPWMRPIPMPITPDPMPFPFPQPPPPRTEPIGPPIIGPIPAPRPDPWWSRRGRDRPDYHTL